METSQLRLSRFFSERTLLYLVIILSLVCIIIASYLVFLHYDLKSQVVCPVGDCNEVLKSEYAEFYGIPIALMGLVGFILIFAASLIRLMYPGERTERFIEIIFLLSILGTAFGVYLTYLELFVIHAICIYCLVCFILMLVILALVTVFFFEVRKGPHVPVGDDEPE
ncbi:MAG: vitamin K epoxide reductase family protein [Thermoplasmata archaeon]|nr:vitamin K epoxide reductase family protein [Thermoplasmata archaeon]